MRIRSIFVFIIPVIQIFGFKLLISTRSYRSISLNIKNDPKTDNNPNDISNSQKTNDFSVGQVLQVLANTLAVASVAISLFLGSVAFKTLVDEVSNARYEDSNARYEEVKSDIKSQFTDFNSQFTDFKKETMNQFTELKSDIKTIKSDVDGLKVFQGVTTAIGVFVIGLSQEFSKTKITEWFRNITNDEKKNEKDIEKEKNSNQ